MPVSPTINSDNFLCGFTNVEKESTTEPFSSFIAPISIIESSFVDNPVVSISTTTTVPNS